MKAKKNSIFGSKQKKKNKSIMAHVSDRMDNIRRNMSRGAANIYKMIKSRSSWGNKQLWGWKEKGKATARKKSVTYKSTKVKRKK